jgi:hypothetical protein
LAERSAIETCPSCGQRLLTQQAARRLHDSELERERELDTAVRARLAELARVAARLEAEHQERLDHLHDRPGPEEEEATARTDYAEAVDVLRTFFRQF